MSRSHSGLGRYAVRSAARSGFAGRVFLVDGGTFRAQFLKIADRCLILVHTVKGCGEGSQITERV